MAELVIRDKVLALSRDERLAAISLCPFAALEECGGTIAVNSGCRMCGICVNKGPAGVFEIKESEGVAFDKSDWKGIAVFIDNSEGSIHPVSLELIGKALELSRPVYALLIGHNLSEQAEELLHYGVDEVFAYDYEQLSAFRIEPYTNVFENFVKGIKPSAMLVGATPAGRSLAPRVAARLRTGVTADCTRLEMNDGELVQIRPAFGGNIMARIVTPNHRPQLATVRYKIFNSPKRSKEAQGKLSWREISEDKLQSRITLVSTAKKEPKKTISEAEIIVAVGRGFKSEKDVAMARELAELLGAELAATRPITEAGWVSANRQIGLSGRTVKPKLIITLGVSGSVQFKAGMENSDLIIAVNTDENAAIFDVCHYAVKADIYDIVPRLVRRLNHV